ncbi:hypothetical protein BB170200_04733 [Mycobacterium marinum]|nr:hypothetical protein BB170200_04733 [Mycobacterium marinum]
MSALRANHPLFRRRRFFNGKPVGRRGEAGLPDIAWFAADGSEMADEDWGVGFAKSIAVFLNGQGIADRDMSGHRVLDDSFILCFNAHFEPIDFTLPPVEFGSGWRVVVATAAATATSAGALPAAATIVVDARSSVVLQAATE